METYSSSRRKLIDIIQVISVVVFTGTSVFGQIDSISVGRNNLLLSDITPGKCSYAVWSIDATTRMVSQISIWNRELSFEKINGKEVIIVRQMRYYNDPARNKSVYTRSDRRSLRTIYDFMTRGTAKEAYNYSDKEIAGADSVKDNTKRDFKLAIQDAPFCFEMDLEILSLLPLKKAGQKLAVNFYHPGGEILPRYYPVEVVGEEEIQPDNGKKVACWKIQLRYSADSFDFSWITKRTHELLKLEGHYPGMTFNKVRLSLPAL